MLGGSRATRARGWVSSTICRKKRAGNPLKWTPYPIAGLAQLLKSRGRIGRGPDHIVAFSVIRVPAGLQHEWIAVSAAGLQNVIQRVCLHERSQRNAFGIEVLLLLELVLDDSDGIRGGLNHRARRLQLLQSVGIHVLNLSRYKLAAMLLDQRKGLLFVLEAALNKPPADLHNSHTTVTHFAKTHQRVASLHGAALQRDKKAGGGSGNKVRRVLVGEFASPAHKVHRRPRHPGTQASRPADAPARPSYDRAGRHPRRPAQPCQYQPSSLVWAQSLAKKKLRTASSW